MTSKTFYAIVTQFDTDPAKCDHDDPARGPILFERYLDVPDATSEEETRALAERWEKDRQHGWARVATITIDIPDSPGETA